VRLFLDAHVSGRRLGRALRELGHDVVAAGDRPELDGADDESLLLLATEQDRVMVTHNARDFVPIVVDWGATGRAHAGCVLIKGIDHSQYGMLLRGLTALFEAVPEQSDWVDRVMWLTPTGL
jgi:predicted nuclease of predicted toxin-antitoxin system